MKINIEQPITTIPLRILPNNSLFVYKNKLYLKIDTAEKIVIATIISETGGNSTQDFFALCAEGYPVKEITVKY